MGDIFNETRLLMKKYGIIANKKLGQNFLIDEVVVETIVNASEVTKDDLVIEIGPGLGTLTNSLLQKAGKVICIELDDRMIKILQDRFYQYENFTIINEDVLKVDLKQLIKKEKENPQIQTVKIVANLPYYITTPIIIKLLEEKLDINTITVMIQKEVADRLSAIPGDKVSGAITYSVYYYAQAKKILTVPNISFIPAPEVESEVIKLVLRKQPPIQVEDEETFFKIIKYAFMQRRKTLINALSNTDLFNNKEQTTNILQELNINTKIRGEALTIQQFAEISNKISGKTLTNN